MHILVLSIILYSLSIFFVMQLIWQVSFATYIPVYAAEIDMENFILLPVPVSVPQAYTSAFAGYYHVAASVPSSRCTRALELS